MATKMQKDLIKIGVLVAVFIIVIFNSLSSVKKKKQKAIEDTEKKRAEMNANKSPEEIAKEAQQKMVKNEAPAVDTERIPLSTRLSKSALKQKEIKEQKKIAESEWGEDPFFHKVPENDLGEDTVSVIDDGAEKIDDTLVLTGISHIGSTFIAVINRKMFKVGDKILYKRESLIIKEIQKDKVILSSNGGDHVLKLNK